MFSSRLVVALVILLSGCRDNTAEQTRVYSGDKTRTVGDQAYRSSVMRPVPVEYQTALQFHGVTSGYLAFSPSFFDSGRVEAVFVVEGERVLAGDILAKLYSPSLEERLLSAQAQLVKNEADLQLRKAQLSRRKKLFSNGALSRQEMDEFQNDFDVAEQNVKTAQADLTLAKTALENLSIKAPVDGLISTVHKQAGDFVSAGEPVLQYQESKRQKAQFFLPERIAITLKPGVKRSLYFPSLNRFVVAIARERSLPVRGGLPMHEVTFELADSHPELMGLRTVLVVEGEQINTYEVDFRTVHYDAQNEPYMIRSDRSFSKIPVELVLLKTQSVLIRADLAATDEVLVSSSIQLPINLHRH